MKEKGMHSEKDLMQTQLKRSITKLFKNFLIIADDIRQDHLGVIVELQSQFPKEMVDRLNYLDTAKYSRIRKKILDSGNDSLREMESIVADFDVVLSDKVVDEHNLGNKE